MNRCKERLRSLALFSRRHDELIIEGALSCDSRRNRKLVKSDAARGVLIAHIAGNSYRGSQSFWHPVQLNVETALQNVLESNQAISCVIAVSNCECLPIAARSCGGPQPLCLGKATRCCRSATEVRETNTVPAYAPEGGNVAFPLLDFLRILRGPWWSKKQCCMNDRLRRSLRSRGHSKSGGRKDPRE